MARTSTKPYDGPILHGQTFDFAQADDVLSKLVPGDSIRFDGIPDPDTFRAKLNEWRLKRKAEFDGTLGFMCSGNEATLLGRRRTDHGPHPRRGRRATARRTRQGQAAGQGHQGWAHQQRTRRHH